MDYLDKLSPYVIYPFISLISASNWIILIILDPICKIVLYDSIWLSVIRNRPNLSRISDSCSAWIVWKLGIVDICAMVKSCCIFPWKGMVGAPLIGVIIYPLYVRNLSWWWDHIYIYIIHRPCIDHGTYCGWLRNPAPVGRCFFPF